MALRRFPILSLLLLAPLSLPGMAHGQLAVLEGSCGELDSELVDASPYLFTSLVEVEECDLVGDALSPGGAKVLEDGNLGGSSLYSELFAYELIFQCDDAALLKTEGEIEYEQDGPKTDFLVDFAGTKIGVSVTRGLTFPFDQPLTTEMARALLEDKLGDILVSSANVGAADAWEKQILFIATPLADSRAALESAYAQIDASTRSDTVVWIADTELEDEFLYSNSNPSCSNVPAERQSWGRVKGRF